MKRNLLKLLFVFAVMFSVFTITSSAQAAVYYSRGYATCKWVPGHRAYGRWIPGHRVCWKRYRYRHCVWIPAHRYHGVWYPGHKVCRY